MVASGERGSANPPMNNDGVTGAAAAAGAAGPATGFQMPDAPSRVDEPAMQQFIQQTRATFHSMTAAIDETTRRKEALAQEIAQGNRKFEALQQEVVVLQGKVGVAEGRAQQALAEVQQGRGAPQSGQKTRFDHRQLALTPYGGEKARFRESAWTLGAFVAQESPKLREAMTKLERRTDEVKPDDFGGLGCLPSWMRP